MTPNPDDPGGSNPHLNLLCDVGELAAALTGSPDIAAFLARTVELVAAHLQAGVCSIYLYEDENRELVLRATRGLTPSSVGRVRLRLGEGLAGTVLAKARPLRTERASQHPNFKSVAGINEEGFEAFLAVPILRGVEKVGVLVVQRETERPFSADAEMTLKATASQLAGAIENARLLMAMSRVAAPAAPPLARAVESRLIRGQAASPGLAHGPAIVIDKVRDHQRLYDFQCAETYGLEDFRAAVGLTEKELEEQQTRLADRLPELASLIFTVHRMILKDVQFVGAIEERVQAGLNSPEAVLQVTRHFADRFAANPHAYVREKARDVEDVAKRLLANLCRAASGGGESGAERVVVARELFPSDIIKLSSENVAGIVQVGGGVASHVSILARSLQIPVVIVEDVALLELPDGTPVLLDAEIGNAYIRPGPEVVERFRERERLRQQTAADRGTMRPETLTRDGRKIALLANINLLGEISLARELLAEGVGLYRSEFPFLVRSSFPSEQEQYVVYRALVERMSPRPVTIRTLDVGGDKVLAYYDHSGEENPALGLRSLRFSLKHPDLFRAQLRAILRAGAGTGELKVLLPMVCSVDQFAAARTILDECLSDLARSSEPHCSAPVLGVMVEVPSLIELIDELAAEADFFSIGTNDFVQYLLAVDRTNELVADYYVPHHPAVLRALRRLTTAVQRHGKTFTVCGEMAHDPRYVPFLLGLGVEHFSVDPQYLPVVQRTIRHWSFPAAREYAEVLLAEATVEGVSRRLTTAGR